MLCVEVLSIMCVNERGEEINEEESGATKRAVSHYSIIDATVQILSAWQKLTIRPTWERI